LQEFSGDKSEEENRDRFGSPPALAFRITTATLKSRRKDPVPIGQE
jgi:hypothetical protein